METLLPGLLVLVVLREGMTFPIERPESRGQSQAGPSTAEQEFAEAYLKNFYGYKPPSERQKRSADCGEDPSTQLLSKVKEMQRFFGLQATGELTGDTLSAMRKPRCGLSDVEPFGETVRWKKSTLSYRISSFSPNVRASRARKIFRAAWKLWSEVTPVRFRKRNRREADIVISFHRGDHEDGSPFDGRGGILAHAFMPGFGIGGDVHFDGEEDWTFNATNTGFNLFPVAVHEFGHALGLAHSSDPGAVMFPAYTFVPQAELQLSLRDVKDAQHIYGINPNFFTLSLKRPPPRTPDKCDKDLSFDAVTELQQEVLFFKDRFMWRKHPNFEEIGISLMTSLWSDRAPQPLDAAYMNLETNSMYFFKGHQYWVMKQLKVQEGFPRNISDLGFPPWIRSVDAALHFREEHLTVFFTGHECWRYNEKTKTMDENSPTPISREWPGVPTPLDAAVFYEGFVYFFKGNIQYKYDPKVKYVISTRPANDMLECKEEMSNDIL